MLLQGTVQYLRVLYPDILQHDIVEYSDDSKL